MFSFKRSDPDRLSLEAFREALAADPDAVVLDVRTPAEFAEGALVGADNVDVMAPDFAERVEGLDRARPYYLYCRSGNRSGQAAQRMRAMGFTDVHNVGGFEELARAGFDAHRP